MAAEAEKDKREESDDEKDLWMGWKDIFLVGTEFHNMAEVYKRQWNFDHLWHDLTEGELAAAPGKIYMFAATEPQLVDNHVVPIPHVVVISTTAPPPTEIGINSVQMREEKAKLLQMSSLKMDWAPMIRPGVKADKKTPKIFALHCNQRRVQVKHLKEARVDDFEYSIPYIFLPHVNDEEYSKQVTVNTNVGGKHVLNEFNWEMDDLDDMAAEWVKDRELDDSFLQAMKDAINEEVAKGKEINKKKRADRAARVASIPQEVQDALKQIKFYKYYPQRMDEINQYKVAFINRFYGRAHALK